MAEVKGLRELGVSMSFLKNEVRLRIGARATSKAAAFIRDLAKIRAPVAPEEVTPKVPFESLKNSIAVAKVRNTPLTSEHFVYVKGGAKNFHASHVASLNEFGTVKMPAQPFMRPAFDSGKSTAAQILIEEVAKGVERGLRKESKL